MKGAKGIGGRASATKDKPSKTEKTKNTKMMAADRIAEQYLEILRLRAQVSEVESRRNPGQNL
ncbi:hypothetical protein [Bradyrhizobium sp. Tv2a-2]|uniref:hypothetical protein n=1 Tax=Bradyrhizobium sp. Tv2a-2 TaxID=113395 RepID=UPI000428B697|nr:hypothetical protein [Bradyrhizobium sp. Tv2a-2]